MLRSLLAICTLLRSSLAVFADEAWNIDYHHALLGEPKDSTTFFHRPNPESRASLIYTLSEKGVLGAVNPRDGDVVWRQLLDAGSKVTAANTSFLRAGDGQDVVVSGLGRQVAAWSAGDGRLVWSHDVAGELQDVEIIELPDARSTGGAKDALIMVGGGHAAVQRLDGATGAVKWEHKLESGDTPYQVSASATEVFAILLHKTMLGYIKIKVISLDPVTGRKADEHALSSERASWQRPTQSFRWELTQLPLSLRGRTPHTPHSR
jgi:outer membrane protein assembly factor BamB